MIPRQPRDGGAPHGEETRRLLEPKQINTALEYEVQYWSRAFGVGRTDLLAAVAAVGTDARAVSRQLGKG
jgi:hypothetical protein